MEKGQERLARFAQILYLPEEEASSVCLESRKWNNIQYNNNKKALNFDDMDLLLASPKLWTTTAFLINKQQLYTMLKLNQLANA